MEKPAISEKALPFLAELRKLIREGVTASNSLESSSLIDLPIVLSRCDKHASSLVRAHVFIETLRHVIKHHLEGKDAEVANILFGLDDYAGMPIRERYNAVAKVYSPYWTWENYRKEPLTRYLFTVYLALEHESVLAPHNFQDFDEPSVARSGSSGQDWVLEHFDGSYVFPSEPGRPFDVIQTRRLRAVCQVTNLWRYRAMWRERGVSSIPRVTLLGPGKAVIANTHADEASGIRVFVVEVQFTKAVNYGESIEFTIILSLDVEFERMIGTGQDWFGFTRASHQIGPSRIRLRFPVNTIPKAVWRHESHLDGLIAPGKPTENNRLSVDASGYVESTWSELYAGMSYGISLNWTTK